MQQVKLSYNGIYTKHRIADAQKLSQSTIEMFKYNFAEKYNIIIWVKTGHLSKENFYYDSNNKFSNLNYESLDANRRDVFLSDINKIIPQIEITFEQ